jgi:hypothetical protein
LATDKLGMSLPQQGQIIMVHSRPSYTPAPDIVQVELKIAKNYLPLRRF